MSNVITGFQREIWDRVVQRDLEKSLVSMKLARFGFSDTNGAKKFHRPDTAGFYAVGYTAGTPLTTQPVVTKDEYIEPNQTRAVPFYIDDTEQAESGYNIYETYSPKAVYALKNDIDGKFFSENAAGSFANVGKLSIEGSGTDDQGATINKTNVLDALSIAKFRLLENGVEDSIPMYAALTPRLASAWELATAYKNTSLGDVSTRNGYLATMPGLGMNLYMTNNLKHTQTLAGTTIANGNKIVIGGVEFTFKTSAAAAGDVKVGANDAASLANLALAINGEAPNTGSHVNVEHEDRVKLQANMVSANTAGTLVTSAGYVTITAPSTIAVSAKTAYAIVAQHWAVDMVLQRNVQTKTQEGTNKGLLGLYVTSWTKFGIKMFNEGKQRSVNLVTAS